MHTKKWILTADGGTVSAELAEAIAATGFVTDTQLDEMGVVIGSADDATAEKLRQLDGIGDVSEDDAIDIGPPDGPDTW